MSRKNRINRQPVAGATTQSSEVIMEENQNQESQDEQLGDTALTQDGAEDAGEGTDEVVDAAGDVKAADETAPAEPVHETATQPAAAVAPVVEAAPVAPAAPAVPAAVTLAVPADAGQSGQVAQQQPVAQTAPVAQTKPVAVAAAATNAASSTESLAVAGIRHAIDEYIVAMAPGKPVSEKVGSSHQIRLYNTMMTVINRLTDDDFAKGMGILLDAFEKHREGAFATRYVFRFMEHIELSSPRIAAFQRLINMFQLMAPGQSRRQAASQCNWGATLTNEITDAGRNRVLAYFHVG